MICIRPKPGHLDLVNKLYCINNVTSVPCNNYMKNFDDCFPNYLYSRAVGIASVVMQGNQDFSWWD